MHPPARFGRFMAIVIAAMLTACGGDGGGGGGASTPTTPPLESPVPVGDTVALTASGKLISFDRATPSALVGSITVTGLAAAETLLGIDFRPIDGKLYAVGSAGGIYTVDPSTGIAAQKVTMVTAIGDNQPFTTLQGTRFAVGFNPATDRMRIVSDTGQNLHVNVDNGATVTDLAINGATATVAAVAHTNALPAVVQTRLYDIDSSTGTVYSQAAPNDGTLSAPVPLGVSFTAVGGFSIDGRNNIAYAALAVAGGTRLFTVPLGAGGSAVDIGLIGSGEALLGLALTQPLAVHVVALTADGGTLLLFDAAAPNVITATLPITGLASGETVLGFDYRPADRRLYGLTSSARIVAFDTATGAATLVSTLVADPTDDTLPYAGLDGTRFSVDFDPVDDRLRVISDTGANVRIDVDTGAVTTDSDIQNGDFGERMVIAAAYGHSHAGATSTVLYDLVTNSDVVATQSPPNDGTLVDIGPVPFNLQPGAAMDIAGGDDGLFLVAAQIVEGEPWVLFAPTPTVSELFRGDLYRNPDRANYPASYIGGAQGPAIIDIAIQPL